MKGFSTSLKSSAVFAGLLISAAVSGIVIAAVNAGIFQRIELKAYDIFLSISSDRQYADDRIVLVEITEADIQKHKRWPMPDETIARLIRKLAPMNPRVIGLDIYRDIPIPPGTDELYDVMKTTPHLVTVEKFGDSTHSGIEPPPTLKGTDQVGANDIIIDPDGIVRRGILFLDDGEKMSYSLSLRLALAYLRMEGIVPEPGERDAAHLKLGKTTFVPFESSDGAYVNADARGYQYMLDYKGLSRPFATMKLDDVLSGSVPADMVRDKIVVIGVTAQSVNDVFHAPYNSATTASNWVYGLHLHGLTASQILRAALEGARLVKPISDYCEWGWIILWSVFGSALGMRIAAPWRFAVIAAAGFVTLELAGYVVFVRGIWMPLVAPGAAWFASSYLTTSYMSSLEKRRRNLLMNLFSRHVSPEVADEIWNKRDQFMDGGRPRPQKITATVLFTDIKGFTTISEKMEPDALMEWLNRYMEAMSETVIRHNGVVSKYIGDAVMALFGVPVPSDNAEKIASDAVNAVECAIEMGEELERLNVAWQEKGEPQVAMRVGIFTGPLVAGDLGGARRMEYTVIGDTVNTASRLESFDKTVTGRTRFNHLCRILVGDSTLKYLGERFDVEFVGEIALKGKDQKTAIYIVNGRKNT